MPIELDEQNVEASNDDLPKNVDIPSHFKLHRMHTLLGIIPLSIFLIIHLIQASTSTLGVAVHDSIRNSTSSFPFAPMFETFIILIPLAFHAVYGITISIRCRNNSFSYPLFDNFRYTFQRYTGYFLAMFVVVHTYLIWTKIRFEPAVTSIWNDSPSVFLAEILRDPSMMAFHYLGVVAVAFHCANGVWNASIKLGVNRKSQLGVIISSSSIALFVLLCWLGIAAIKGFQNIPIAEG